MVVNSWSGVHWCHFSAVSQQSRCSPSDWTKIPMKQNRAEPNQWSTQQWKWASHEAANPIWVNLKATREKALQGPWESPCVTGVCLLDTMFFGGNHCPSIAKEWSPFRAKFRCLPRNGRQKLKRNERHKMPSENVKWKKGHRCHRATGRRDVILKGNPMQSHAIPLQGHHQHRSCIIDLADVELYGFIMDSSWLIPPFKNWTWPLIDWRAWPPSGGGMWRSVLGLCEQFHYSSNSMWETLELQWFVHFVLTM